MQGPELDQSRTRHRSTLPIMAAARMPSLPGPQHGRPCPRPLKGRSRTPCRADPNLRLFCVFTDIDECEQPEVCTGGRCTNTEGSYHCKCDEGYIMVRKGHCQGKEGDAPPQSPAPSPPSPLPAYPSLGPLMLSPRLGTEPVWEFQSPSVLSVRFWHPVCPCSRGAQATLST